METTGRKKSKNVWKVIAIVLIIFVVAALALKGCGQALSKIPSVPSDYTQKVKTGGEIEAEYLAMGSHEVEHLESVTVSSLEKFEVYYPKDIDNPNTVYNHFKEIVTRIGAPEVRFHDMRHSYAVAALQAGDDVKTVQGNLGHATAAFTLDVYGHVTDQMKEESANRMERFIHSVRTA